MAKIIPPIAKNGCPPWKAIDYHFNSVAQLLDRNGVESQKELD